MRWISFASENPPSDVDLLYYDGKNKEISIATQSDSKQRGIYSMGYYCNREKCKWIFDDCCHPLVIGENDYWMYLPDKPGKK